jgi:hypothetical protein
MSASFAVFRNQWQIFLALGLASAFANWLTDLPSSLVENAGLSFLLLLLSFAPGLVVGVLAQGAMIKAVIEAEAGRDPDLGEALSASTARVGDMFWASVRGLAICLGFATTVIGLPWAVNRAVKWIFTAQAVMLDGQDSHTALGYSADMVNVRGWWTTFRRLLVLGLVTAIPGVLVWVASLTLIDSFIVRSALQILAGGLTTPFFAASTTILYLNLRLLAQEMTLS